MDPLRDRVEGLIGKSFEELLEALRRYDVGSKEQEALKAIITVKSTQEISQKLDALIRKVP